MTCLILCGGSGTRLWPLSRQYQPKQFSRLLHGHTLFESTVERNRSEDVEFMIASNADQAFLATAQLKAMGVQACRYLVEPVGRNTAPAIALACFGLPHGEVVLVSPSDHVIRNTDAYRMILAEARALAASGALVTFGIQPNAPETGYGYIEAEGSRVRSFKEKPNAETARAYLEAGNYLWNSGMFCFKAGTFLAELERLAPEVYLASRTAYQNALGELGAESDLEVLPERIEPSLADMEAIPSISIDYAVMEKSSNVRCVICPPDFGWNDLGSHDALYAELKDESPAKVGSDGSVRGMVEGNAVSAAAAPVFVSAKNNLVISDRQTALVGVKDLLVVDSADALLVMRRGAGQYVKEVVKHLSGRRSPLLDFFPTVERPWGNYTVLFEAEGYKVKRIEVRPGQRLSLQRHKHREEHWTVVEGSPIVQVGEDSRQYEVGQAIHIPRTAIHRLENPGTDTVAIIETQLGSYLGEDDIERLADDYQRG